MKLIMAIVNKDDAAHVTQEVTKAGFSVTKVASSGGFLQTGNVTVMIGTEEDRVDELMGIIATHSKRRTKKVFSTNDGVPHAVSVPVEVVVGGATVFVLDVERFEKL